MPAEENRKGEALLQAGRHQVPAGVRGPAEAVETEQDNRQGEQEVEA